MSRPSWATYSLIAADSATGEIGGFVISCVGTEFDLAEVLWLGDTSLVAAQGYFFAPGRDELIMRLSQGISQKDALAAALSPSIDPVGLTSGPSYRQYAALGLDGLVSQHSGSDLSPYAGHKTATVETLTYALQGNILTESAVLDSLERGFSAPSGTIVERSISALRTLAESGGGDSRCSPLSGDAGYFVRRAMGTSTQEVRADALEPGEEVSRVLAQNLEVEFAELLNGIPPGAPATPNANPEAESPQPRDSAGCSITRGVSLGPALWAVCAALVLCTRRRLKSRLP